MANIEAFLDRYDTTAEQIAAVMLRDLDWRSFAGNFADPDYPGVDALAPATPADAPDRAVAFTLAVYAEIDDDTARRMVATEPHAPAAIAAMRDGYTPA